MKLDAAEWMRLIDVGDYSGALSVLAIAVSVLSLVLLATTRR